MIGFHMFNGQDMVKVEATSVAQLKRTVFEMKEQFKEKNCFYGIKDRQYENYCNELDAILEKIVSSHLKEDAICHECLPEDHEGEFCRCESRNIRIAKLNRLSV